MSAEIAASSASPLDSQEAQGRQHHGAIKPGEIAAGVIIGRTSEFFDFFVYAIASVVVFPKLVFSYTDPLHGTLASFLVFALAFVARPFGTVIFMAVDRRFGRSVKLTGALLLLGGSTCSIAFLPGYAEVGSASVLLLSVFRIGQGLALGGAWDGLPSLLALNAPADRRGWYAMIPQLGAPLGLIVASGLYAYFEAKLTPQDFFDWGWRYPFYCAFAINVVALFARLRMVETPEYKAQFENRALEPTRVRETVRAEGANILIGALAPLASFTMFHMVTVFPLSWVFLFTKERPESFLIIELVSATVGVFTIVASGMLADQMGRRKLLGATAMAIAIFSGFAPQLLNGGDLGEAVFMVFGFILLGLSLGQASGAVASNFSLKYRYTGSALTSDLAWLLGAGFAPYVALRLAATPLGLMASGGFLLSGAIVTMAALAINRQLAERDR